MAVFLYNIFLLFFRLGAHLASLFNPKAKKWVQGRKGLFEKLEQAIPKGEKIIWMHCASLGEFEQGRPVIERLNTQGTGHKILLTFFSPSGYEVRKDYEGADWVFYLPLDGPRNARRFLEIVQPTLVIFIKYEFWYYYLKKIKYRNIPLLLVSALFRKDMSFFKWYGGIQRKILSRFDHLFVQDEASKKLLDEIGLGHITSVSGDTRFDRVIEIAEKFKPLQEIEEFIGDSKTIVAGSTWLEDEKLLSKSVAMDDPLLTVIIAPHEINDKYLAAIKEIFPGSLRLSEVLAYRDSASFQKAKRWFLDTRPTGTSFLIIDNVGILSRLYKYADITFVGGGFRPMGVHNVLEAAVYGKPVLMGPYISKYREAVELVSTQGGIVVNNAEEMKQQIAKLVNDKNKYDAACTASLEYIRSNAGAVEKILNYIQENRLLTS